jgi:hypothetical protein
MEDVDARLGTFGDCVQQAVGREAVEDQPVAKSAMDHRLDVRLTLDRYRD